MNMNKPLRMKSVQESRYTTRPLVTVETIARVLEIDGIDDALALELLSTIHPVDRARVYRALDALPETLERKRSFVGY